jgi:lysyl-tRNA synthetase class 2
MTEPPSVAWRVRLWDAVLESVRAYFRSTSVREVATPLRLAAPAVEPWIEPIASAGAWLRTSPELSMKRLLCAGSGPIFEIAPVFRDGERGLAHREEFHLIEWYRDTPDLAGLMDDVEAIVERARACVATLEGTTASLRPMRWNQVECLADMGETLDRNLTSTTPSVALFDTLEAVSAARVGTLSEGVERGPRAEVEPPDSNPNHRERVGRLAAWSELFTFYCDARLEPRLRAGPGDQGTHLTQFPTPLAAMAEIRDGAALRFESFVGGTELANGYVELRDPKEQRERFETVNGLRLAVGLAGLPVDVAFLSALEKPGLPPCAGCALGLERLLMVATGRTDIGELQILD